MTLTWKPITDVQAVAGRFMGASSDVQAVEAGLVFDGPAPQPYAHDQAYRPDGVAGKGGSQAIMRLQGVPPTVADVAQETGLTVAQLRAYNPWIAKAMGMNAPEHVQLPRVFRVYTAGVRAKAGENPYALARRVFKDQYGRPPTTEELTATHRLLVMWNPGADLNALQGHETLSLDLEAMGSLAKFPDNFWDGLDQAWDAIADDVGIETATAIFQMMMAIGGVGLFLTLVSGVAGLASYVPLIIAGLAGIGIVVTAAQVWQLLEFLFKSATGQYAEGEIQTQGAALNLGATLVNAGTLGIGLKITSPKSSLKNLFQPKSSTYVSTGQARALASRPQSPEQLGTATIGPEDLVAISQRIDDIAGMYDDINLVGDLEVYHLDQLRALLPILDRLANLRFTCPQVHGAKHIHLEAEHAALHIRAVISASEAGPVTTQNSDVSFAEMHIHTLTEVMTRLKTFIAVEFMNPMRPFGDN